MRYCALSRGNPSLIQCSYNSELALSWRLSCADPVIKIAIEPKSKGDLEKMSNGLIKLAQEDPSFHFTRDEETNQTVIEGMGELHLDIIVDRLRREFKARVPSLSCYFLITQHFPNLQVGSQPQGLQSLHDAT